jgi:ring-1,2-phenylacetyl-CoA epoxidase subunit PaaD
VVSAALEDARRIAAATPDPEVPVLTIEDLGILRRVDVDDAGRVVVDITPTYSGCPALEAIRTDVEQRLHEGGHRDVTVNVVLSPAWTTDWMSEDGRRKLQAYGIAPPRPVADSQTMRALPVACPVCGSAHTTEVAHFGATPCQAMRRCSGCAEPFAHFKEH